MPRERGRAPSNLAAMGQTRGRRSLSVQPAPPRLPGSFSAAMLTHGCRKLRDIVNIYKNTLSNIKIEVQIMHIIFVLTRSGETHSSVPWNLISY